MVESKPIQRPHQQPVVEGALPVLVVRGLRNTSSHPWYHIFLRFTATNAVDIDIQAANVTPQYSCKIAGSCTSRPDSFSHAQGTVKEDAVPNRHDAHTVCMPSAHMHMCLCICTSAHVTGTPLMQIGDRV